MPLSKDIPIITSRNYRKFIDHVVDGEKKRRGLKPRDYRKHPMGSYSFAEPFPDSLLIPEDEIDDRIKQQEKTKSGLLDLREANYSVLKSLDQDGLGLCWAFSSTKAIMYLRAIMGVSPLILSAWWVAGKVKSWRDQGGWGAESLAQIVKAGVPAMSFCPSYKSSYDTADTRADALLHTCTEWWEGSEDPVKARRQMFSALLGSAGPAAPCITDWNFWSHSVCAIKAKQWKPTPQVVIDNSWGESAGDKGLYILEGNKSKPDGLWIPRVTRAT